MAKIALLTKLSLTSTDAKSANIEKQEMLKFLGEGNPLKDLDLDSDSDSDSDSHYESGVSQN